MKKEKDMSKFYKPTERDVELSKQAAKLALGITIIGAVAFFAMLFAAVAFLKALARMCGSL